MKNKELNISWCYPDILNLNGDRGNIMALKKVAELLNIKVNINRISNYNDKIDFTSSDILLFNVGEIKSTSYLVDALKEKKDELDKYINDNKMIIIIGTTVCAFGKKLVMLDGSEINGLGILDLECYEREKVYGNDLIYKINDSDMKVNGNQISLVDVKLNSDIRLGTTIYGNGNNGNTDEGAKYKNVIFTNCLGPVFVKNPWFAEDLIRTAMKTKNVKLTKKIDKKNYDLELKSMECIEEYNKNK